MSLSDFVRDHHREIIEQFEAFARTLGPISADMTSHELRDHAEELLTAIVADMETVQGRQEQTNKSEGTGIAHSMEASALLHADARADHRFTADQVIAEFRALRASVLRLYDDQGGEADLTGVRRFNEAIDEALGASMVRFSRRMDLYRDEFIGILSHDLRTPLSAIITGASLLAMSTDVDPQRAKVASRMLTSSQRMLRMVTDLLDLTHTRLGKGIPITRAPTDLQQVCEEAVSELKAVYPAADLRYEPDGDLHGEWDSGRLRQLVSNLVGNAIEHGDGSPVTVSARGSADAVVIAVHNAGPAIPKQVQRSIFEPLVRHVPAGGTLSSSIGLGLFIARAVVVSHGGSLGVTSTDQEGTTFEARLPRGGGVAATEAARPRRRRHDDA